MLNCPSVIPTPVRFSRARRYRARLTSTSFSKSLPAVTRDPRKFHCLLSISKATAGVGVMITRCFWPWMAAFLTSMVFSTATPVVAEANGDWLVEAQELDTAGNFAATIRILDKNLPLESDPNKKCDGLLLKASAHQNLGHHEKTYSSLNEARTIGEGLADAGHYLLVLVRLADFFIATGRHDEGSKIGNFVLNEARNFGDENLLSLALNNSGNIAMVVDDWPLAMECYRESVALARELDNSEFIATVLLNLAIAALNAGDLDLATTAVVDSAQFLKSVPNNYMKASLLLSVGLQAFEIYKSGVGDVETRKLKSLAASSFSAADRIALQLPNARLRSYANGYLAHLYEIDGRYNEAFQLTNIALFAASQGDNPEILYQWYWQSGRLLRATGRTDEAIAAYSNAIATLTPIRNELTVGVRHLPESFERKVKPVYYELASIYIGQSIIADQETTEQHFLRRALDTVELLKTAELENYFQDQCVAALQAQQIRLDQQNVDASIVYPIILKNKLVTLLISQDNILRFSVDVDADAVKTEVLAFRKELQKRSSKRYMYAAQKLYSWIIGPLEEELKAQNVDTLVIIPDGVLRLIPFPTLHDGENYLIQKFAIATTPGLKLTDPKPIDRDNLKTLLGGLSKSVQGHAALPSVPEELKSINDVLTGDLLMDEDFTATNVYNALRNIPYGIVHFATHAEFDRNPKKTYLLAHDKKITMDELESLIKLGQFRDNPIELLTLSACRTAVGDERSALGLAGIAVKSGARGAIATLWYVSDEATKLVITEFYRQLQKDPGISKAKALQSAQKSVLSQRRFRHPAYWGPYLLIGNWL